jgi:hypothetical protein
LIGECRWRLDYTNFMQQGKRQEFPTRRNATDVRFIPSACSLASQLRVDGYICASAWLTIENRSGRHWPLQHLF